MTSKEAQQKVEQWMSRAAMVLVVVCYMAWAVQLGGMIASQAACGPSHPESVRRRHALAASCQLWHRLQLPRILAGFCV